METVEQYKCPSCGAPLTFSPETGMLHCNSCIMDFPVEAIKESEEQERESSKESSFNWGEYKERSFEPDETVDITSYTCPTCGANVMGDSTNGALKCVYCGHNIIIDAQFSGGLKPDFVIPFKVDKKDAMKRLLDSCKGKFLLRSDFKSKSRLENIQGVYVPFWLADCDCDASITYKAVRTKTWRAGNYQYTKNDYYNVFRAGNVKFENIPVDALKRADNAYMDAIEPFDYNSAVDFDTAYLSGYIADRYDESFKECEPRVNLRVKNTVEDEFKKTVSGYTTVTPISSSVNSKNGKLRYVLMPVWMLNVKYGNRTYKFAMNGQTGKMIGEYPVSNWKTFFFFIAMCAVCTGLFGLFMSFISL